MKLIKMKKKVKKEKTQPDNPEEFMGQGVPFEPVENLTKNNFGVIKAA